MGAHGAAGAAGTVEVLTVEGAAVGPGTTFQEGGAVVLVAGAPVVEVGACVAEVTDVPGATDVDVVLVLVACVVGDAVVVVASAVEVTAVVAGAAVVTGATVVAGAAVVVVGIVVDVVDGVAGRVVLAVDDPWMPGPAPLTARTSTV